MTDLERRALDAVDAYLRHRRNILLSALAAALVGNAVAGWTLWGRARAALIETATTTATNEAKKAATEAVVSTAFWRVVETEITGVLSKIVDIEAELRRLTEESQRIGATNIAIINEQRDAQDEMTAIAKRVKELGERVDGLREPLGDSQFESRLNALIEILKSDSNVAAAADNSAALQSLRQELRQELHSRKFLLVDDSGIRRAALELNRHGEPQLDFYDEGGQNVYLELGVTSNPKQDGEDGFYRPYLSMYDERHKERLVTGRASTGSSWVLLLRDREGNNLEAKRVAH